MTIPELSQIDQVEELDLIEEPDTKKKKRIWLWFLWFLLLILILITIYLFWISGYAKVIFSGRRPNPLVEIQGVLNQDYLNGEEEGDINVLFLGIRGEGEEFSYASNAAMLVNFDVDKKTLNTISFPRDMLVSDSANQAKVGEMCKNVTSNPIDCGESAVKKIEYVSGIKIGYFFVMDFEGFIDFINDTDRITINLNGKASEYPFLKEKDFDSAKDADPEVFHLNGAQSLIFVRWPKDAVRDFGRITRQQIFISQAEDQLISPSFILNPIKLKAILETGAKHVRTNFQVWEMLKYANLVSDTTLNKYSLNTDVNAKGGLLVDSGKKDTLLFPVDGENNYESIKKFTKTIVEDN